MNLAALGVLTHILGDALNTVGVIIVGLLTLFVKNPNKKYADPTLSVAVSVSIFVSSLPLLLRSAAVLLQASPKEIPQHLVLQDILRLKYVEQVHEFHIWQIDQRRTIASAHVILENVMHPSGATEDQAHDSTLKEIRTCLHAWGIHSVTLQLERCQSAVREQQASTSRSIEDLQGLLVRRREHNSVAHKTPTCIAEMDIRCGCTSESMRRCCA